MRGRGRRDHERVHPGGEQILWRRGHRAAQFGGQGTRARLVGIAERHGGDARQPRERASVEGPDTPGADDADAEG